MLATDVNLVCTGATEYALSIGDTDLQYAIRFRTSDITEAKDGNVQGITTITDAVTPLLDKPEFQEYEITADISLFLSSRQKRLLIHVAKPPSSIPAAVLLTTT